MKRRSFFATSMATITGCIFGFKSKPTIGNDKPDLQISETVKSKGDGFVISEGVYDVFRRAGSRNLSVAMPASQLLVDALMPCVRYNLLEKTRKNYVVAPEGYLCQHVLRYSVDMHLKYIRECRFDIFARVCEVLTNNLADKINKCSDETIVNIKLLVDEKQHQANRFGIIGIVETC